MRGYEDDAEVGRQTAAIVAAGHPVLQVHRFGTTNEHVAYLLELMAPPRDAIVLDAGCGVGAVAAIMKRLRPDIDFLLLNISAAQLEMCPADFIRLHGSFEAIPLPDESVHAIMINYALGHGQLERIMAEALRVLKPNGILFIYDLVGKPERLALLDYRVHDPNAVITGARGFALDFVRSPPGSSAREFIELVGQETYDAAFAESGPIVYRFIKC